MVQDCRHPNRLGDRGERQRVKDHVKSMLRKLVSKAQRPSDQKGPK
jgi:hypothetical protein